MTSSLEVLFAPAEFAALAQRDLGQTVCVVFDILRATSSMMTALENGARKIIPVAEIHEALALRRTNPDLLLAGERNGLRILADQSGGTEFDLGNSPREFTRERVAGKTIVITTTNGTRALRACATAHRTWVGSFLGLRAVADWISAQRPPNLLLICAGTIEQAAYEDALGAGALTDLIWSQYEGGLVADSALMTRQIYREVAADMLGAMARSRNGRRLLSNPDLREDVAVCAQRDTIHFLAEMSSKGSIQRVNSSAE